MILFGAIEERAMYLDLGLISNSFRVYWNSFNF